MKDQALADAREAVTLDPANARARLALSYAAQAAFDIPLARASLEAAVHLHPRRRPDPGPPGRGPAHAGRHPRRPPLRRARALALDPANARAQSVAGFVALARLDTRTANAAFARAHRAATRSTALPRLGQGLATIRDGDLEAGASGARAGGGARSGQCAAAELSRQGLSRERRDRLAGDELATAKALDPNDPTPWFYDAIRKQLDNRPIEALTDLERSTELVEGRAVYRSPLLLDEDRAARGVSLARIYADLGFTEAGRVLAARALTRCQRTCIISFRHLFGRASA